MSSTSSDDPPTPERLRRLINGYQVTQVIYVAVGLGIPDLVADGARTDDELAAATSCDAGSLQRLVRALVALGILRRAPDGSLELTEMGKLLTTDAEGSLVGWAAFVARPYHWQAWGDLEVSVRTGRTAFDARHGENVWAWRERHPDESRIFDRAMRSLAATVGPRAVAAYDFGRFATVADIGGGDGTLMAAILERNPRLHGVVFDLPHVVAGAESTLRDRGVWDRCTAVGGSYFDTIPAGCDAYVMKSVLHDCDDASATQILQGLRDTIDDDGVLLVIERILDDADPSVVAAMSDLNMMVNTGGRERTIEQWRALADASGFRITSTIDVGFGWYVIEALPETDTGPAVASTG